MVLFVLKPSLRKWSLLGYVFFENRQDSESVCRIAVSLGVRSGRQFEDLNVTPSQHIYEL
jgi:hypothetical protein